MREKETLIKTMTGRGDSQKPSISFVPQGKIKNRRKMATGTGASSGFRIESFLAVALLRTRLTSFWRILFKLTPKELCVYALSLLLPLTNQPTSPRQHLPTVESC